MNANQIYENMLNICNDVQSIIINRDSELWKLIRDLNKEDFPETLPSDCTVFVSEWVYNQLITKTGMIQLPNFIQKSLVVERHKVIIVKQPCF